MRERDRERERERERERKGEDERPRAGAVRACASDATHGMAAIHDRPCPTRVRANIVSTTRSNTEPCTQEATAVCTFRQGIDGDCGHHLPGSAATDPAELPPWR